MNTDKPTSLKEFEDKLSSVEDTFKTEVICVCGETIHVEKTMRLSRKAIQKIYNIINNIE